MTMADPFSLFPQRHMSKRHARLFPTPNYAAVVAPTALLAPQEMTLCVDADLPWNDSHSLSFLLHGCSKLSAVTFLSRVADFKLFLSISLSQSPLRHPVLLKYPSSHLFSFLYQEGTSSQAFLCWFIPKCPPTFFSAADEGSSLTDPKGFSQFWRANFY